MKFCCSFTVNCSACLDELFLVVGGWCKVRLVDMNCGRLVIIVNMSACFGFLYDGGGSLYVSYVYLGLLFAHACFSCEGWFGLVRKICGCLFVPNFSACLGFYMEVLVTMYLMCASFYIPECLLICPLEELFRWELTENLFFSFKRVALMSLCYFYVFHAFL